MYVQKEKNSSKKAQEKSRQEDFKFEILKSRPPPKLGGGGGFLGKQIYPVKLLRTPLQRGFNRVNFFFFAMVFIHLVQTFLVWPLIFFTCRLIYCLLMVLILEWEREASRVEPRPQTSHFFAIDYVALLFMR